MSFYADMTATANEMLAEFGRAVTLTRDNAGAYDPITGTFGSSNPCVSTVKAVFTEFKQSEVDGTLILRGDKKVLLGLGAEPQPNDVVVDGDRSYRVIEIMEVAPGEGVVLYKLQVRA